MGSIDAYWNLDTTYVLTKLSSSVRGLTSEEANRSLKEYGANSIKGRSLRSTFVLFLTQFKSPITILLMVAALISMGLRDVTDALIILFIILVSSILGFWQERGANRAIDKLLKLVQLRCAVLRDGQALDIPVDQVVPGDIIVLNAGDIIPADCLLLFSKELFVDEAAFTGETFPVEKNAGIIPSDTILSKRTNCLFMGAHVISGTAHAVVVHTGSQTEFGKISERISARTPETEFERGIRHFGYMLMEITLILVIVIFFINVLLAKPALDSILFSLALAVGLTPQLLPAIISINLSRGAREMATKEVIVKRLSAIENLGSVNILCTDKTGTITEGKVVLKAALDVEGNISEKTLKYAWLNSSLQKGFNNPIDEAIQSSYHNCVDAYEVQAEVPYDFFRKRLSVQVRNSKENITITKGALHAILDVCSEVETAGGKIVPIADKLEGINREFEKLSAEGYRVLGVACKKGSDQHNFTRLDEVDMIFIGFIVLYDPPKKDVVQTLIDLRHFGVEVKLITGDNALVAETVARQVGFHRLSVLTGSQMRKMSDEALKKQVLLTDIFAEIEPNQKEQIVLLLKKSGHVTGFMGDGINDAPALHAADVGISVDSAVDVAKEAADIVLLRQSLEVLKTGILAGRKTFTNTIKYIFMATSANFGNMFSMAGASFFLPFLPLLPKQILLTNILTDFPEMTIPSDRVDKGAIDRPHRWDLRFIQRFMIVFGLISSVFDFLTFGILIYIMKADEQTFQTGWFTESVLSATLIVLVIRTRHPFYKSLPGKYLSLTTALILFLVLLLPYLPFADLLGFRKLPIIFYGWIFLIVSLYIGLAEVVKRWFFRTSKSSYE